MNIFEQAKRAKEEAELLSKLPSGVQQLHQDFKRMRQQGMEFRPKGKMRKLNKPVILEFKYGPRDSDFYVDEVAEVEASQTPSQSRKHLRDWFETAKQMGGMPSDPPDFIVHGPTEIPGNVIAALHLIWCAAYWSNFHHYPQMTRHISKCVYASALEGLVAAVKFDMMSNEVWVAFDESEFARKVA